MANPLFQQLQQIQSGGTNILTQFLEFQRTFTGDPKQVLQTMLNSGKISQSQLNQLTQQANYIYRQIYGK